jgi:hypothetical protein
VVAAEQRRLALRSGIAGKKSNAGERGQDRPGGANSKT